MHYFNRVYILIYNAVNVTASLGNVSAKSAQNSLVGIRIRIDLNVEKLTEALVVERKDSINDNDGSGRKTCQLIASCVNTEIVVRPLQNSPSRRKHAHR